MIGEGEYETGQGECGKDGGGCSVGKGGDRKKEGECAIQEGGYAHYEAVRGDLLKWWNQRISGCERWANGKGCKVIEGLKKAKAQSYPDTKQGIRAVDTKQ